MDSEKWIEDSEKWIEDSEKWIKRYQHMMYFRPLSVILYSLSVICYPLSTSPLSSLSYPLSSIHYPLSRMRHGFLLIDKPEGPTSHDVVSIVRRQLSERKIGHLGTLDPAASGLLVLAVGSKALKIVELFTRLPKEYLAEVRFGAVSATYDREGPIEEFDRKPGVVDPDDSAVLQTIRSHFLGTIDQVPPLASAIKIGGERAYRKMRQGRSAEMPSRSVVIDACDIAAYRYPDLTLRVACGSGTYIRSLANDLGAALRVGGYLASLRRTAVGDWLVEDAVLPENAKWTNVIPLKEILSGYVRFDLSAAEFDAITHGRTIDADCRDGAIGWYEELPVALLTKASGGGIKARKVL